MQQAPADSSPSSIEKANSGILFGASMAPTPSVFAPLLFAGRLAEGLEALPAAGFSAVEISLRRVSDIDVKWLEKRTSELGIAVSAFASGRICLEDSLCLADKNPVVRQQLYERLIDFVWLAAKFHSSLIIGGVRGKLSGDEEYRKEQYEAAVETLRQVSAIACDLGVNIFIEPINHYETNFINSTEEARALIEKIGIPCVKLLLDTYHMNIEEANTCDTIRNSANQLGYVHFSDNNRQAPGSGQINFRAIFETLVSIGYRGFITAEILPIPDDQEALLQAGHYLNTLLIK